MIFYYKMMDNSDESEGEPPKKITYQRLPREVEEVVGEERAAISGSFPNSDSHYYRFEQTA